MSDYESSISRRGRLDLLVGDGLKRIAGMAGLRMNLPVLEHASPLIDRLVKKHVPSEEMSIERIAEEMGLIDRRPAQQAANVIGNPGGRLDRRPRNRKGRRR